MQLAGCSLKNICVGHNLDANPNPAHYIPHTHENLELLYFIRGTAEYQVEDSVYPLQPGDVLIMREAEMHCLVPAPNSQPYERILVNFSDALLKETLNGKLLEPFYDRPKGTWNHYSVALLPQSFIHQCLTRMCRPENLDNEMRLLTYLLPVLQELYHIWHSRSDLPTEQRELSLAMQIIAYINLHLYELKGLTQLEDAFFLSRSQINRIFRSFTGTSVWDYVQTKRLAAANELLLQGVLPGQAALRCGYQEYATFFRAYKKYFGHSPQNDYRRPE